MRKLNINLIIFGFILINLIYIFLNIYSCQDIYITNNVLINHLLSTNFYLDPLETEFSYFNSKWYIYSGWITLFYVISSIILIGLFLKNNANNVKILNLTSALFSFIYLISYFDNFDIITLTQNFTYFAHFFIAIALVFATIFFLSISQKNFFKENTKIEFTLLIWCIIVASIYLISSLDFISIIILIECIAFSSYVLVGFDRKNKYSTTSGLQYLILASIPGGLFILGFALFYNNFGTFSQEYLNILLQTSNFSNNFSKEQNLEIIDYVNNNASFEMIMHNHFLNTSQEALFQLEKCYNDYLNNYLYIYLTMYNPNLLKIESEIMKFYDANALYLWESVSDYFYINYGVAPTLSEVYPIILDKCLEEEPQLKLISLYRAKLIVDLKVFQEMYSILQICWGYEQKNLDLTTNINTLDNLLLNYNPQQGYELSDPFMSVWSWYYILATKELERQALYGLMITTEESLYENNNWRTAFDIKILNDKEEKILENAYFNWLSSSKIQECTYIFFKECLSNELSFDERSNRFITLCNNQEIFTLNFHKNFYEYLQFIIETWGQNFNAQTHELSYNIFNEFLKNYPDFKTAISQEFCFIYNNGLIFRDHFYYTYEENAINSSFDFILLEKISSLICNETIINFYSNNYLYIYLAIIFIIANLSFKLTAAPFHFWAPAIYGGSPLITLTFLSIFSKTIFIFFSIWILINIFDSLVNIWQNIIIFIAFLSIFISILGAFSEKIFKRFFVYSSTGHVGFMLIGIAMLNINGLKGTIDYLILYILSSFIVWFIIMHLTKKTITLINLKGLSYNQPYLSLIFTLILFSLSGIPPFGGFFVKYEIFYSLINSSFFLLAYILLILTIVSFFYYIRLIKIFYFEDNKKFYKFKNFDDVKLRLISYSFFIIPFFILFADNSISIFIINNIIKSLF